MFLASQMRSILDQVSRLAEELKIPEEYRDAVVKQVQGDHFTPKFKVSVGEICCDCSYILEFERDVLQAIYHEWWCIDGDRRRDRVR